MEQEQLLEEGEVMLEKVRKHWMVYVEDFFIHFFACFIFLIGANYFTARGSLSFIDINIDSYIGMLLVMFVIIFWTSFFYAWTKDYLDTWYVTDRHIIAVNQKQIFEREEAFMQLNRIQDVSFEKSGFVATFFGYGKLKVQSAGTEQEFIMENVNDVEVVARMLMDLRDKNK